MSVRPVRVAPIAGRPTDRRRVVGDAEHLSRWPGAPSTDVPVVGHLVEGPVVDAEAVRHPAQGVVARTG